MRVKGTVPKILIQFPHISEAIGYRNLDREGWGT